MTFTRWAHCFAGRTRAGIGTADVAEILAHARSTAAMKADPAHDELFVA